MTAEQQFESYYDEEAEVDAEKETDSEEKSDDDKTDENVQTEDEQSEKEIRNSETRKGSVLKIVFLSVLAAILLGSVIYSLDRRNIMYNKVSDLNNKLSLAEAENVRLQSELDSRMSAKNVEDYAENVLKMQKIDTSQIKYIKIQTGDVVYIPEQDESLTAKIERFFNNCVEYFKG